MPATPLWGHLAPVLTAARAFVDAGHDVSVLTGRKYRAQVEKSGAEFLALPAEVDYDDDELEAFMPGRDAVTGVAAIKLNIIGLFVRTLPGQYRALQELISDGGFDAVVADATFCGTFPWLLDVPAAQRLPIVGLGVLPLPFASRDTAPFGTALAPSSSVLGRLRNRVLNAVVDGIVLREVKQLTDAALAEVGAGATRTGFAGNGELYDRYFHLACEGIEYPRSDLAASVRFVGPFPPARNGWNRPVPEWWTDLELAQLVGRPVVHVTQGTMDNADLTRVLVPTIRALAEEDVLVVAATGGRPVEEVERHFPDGLPANARVGEFLDYADLLPRCSLVVTNGGWGTVQLALSEGVPVVVAGSTEEKPEVGARVQWAGAGRSLRTGTPTPGQVRKAVREVLATDSHRVAAAGLAQEMAALPDPREVIVAEVEEMIAARTISLPQSRTIDLTALERQSVQH